MQYYKQFAIIISFFSSAVKAGDKEDAEQAVFNQVKGTAAKQIVLGLSEASLGHHLLKSSGTPVPGITTEQRVQAIQQWNQSLRSKTVQSVKAFGGVALIADTAARIYVWSALDANPTLSPTLTFLSAKTGITLYALNPVTTVKFIDPITGGENSFTIDARLSENENKNAMSEVDRNIKAGGSIIIAELELTGSKSILKMNSLDTSNLNSAGVYPLQISALKDELKNLAERQASLKRGLDSEKLALSSKFLGRGFLRDAFQKYKIMAQALTDGTDAHYPGLSPFAKHADLAQEISKLDLTYGMNRMAIIEKQILETEAHLLENQGAIAAKHLEINKLLGEREATLIRDQVKQGKFGKLIRGVRAVGASVLVLDAFSRVIQWNMTDTDPQFSPLATVVVATARQSGRLLDDFFEPILTESFPNKSKNKFLEKHDQLD